MGGRPKTYDRRAEPNARTLETRPGALESRLREALAAANAVAAKETADFNETRQGDLALVKEMIGQAILTACRRFW